MSRALRLAGLAATLALAPAAHAEKIVTMPGAGGPGPAQYNKTRVLQQGPASAKNVLVLEPGTNAGAANFRPMAESMLEDLPGWQIWSLDRRENLLEDHTLTDRLLNRQATPQQVFDYYLGWITNPAITPRFTPKTDAETGFARQWGMGVAVNDLRKVIKAAGKGGRRVVLGGHSLGATITAAYATWDFEGRAGAEDLDGLVFIDGGGGGSTPPTTAAVQEELKKLQTTSPFSDLLGLGLPWSAGVLVSAGGAFAQLYPAEASIVQTWPLFPKFLAPPVPATNAGIFGNALDTESAPASLELIQMHLGNLAPSGDPRGWQDGGLVTLSRAAGLFAGIPTMDGASWYHPRRLSIDGSTVNGGIATAAQKKTGVRSTHGRDLETPIYAFETSLAKGRVLKSARTLARQSKLPKSDLTLVDRSTTFAHLDPIAADPDKNDFVKTVVPFLKRAAR